MILPFISGCPVVGSAIIMRAGPSTTSSVAVSSGVQGCDYLRHLDDSEKPWRWREEEACGAETGVKIEEKVGRAMK
jgi:hypothetical protein